MTIEIIKEDIKRKSIYVSRNDHYICDWYGKIYIANTLEKVTEKIIKKHKLDSLPTIVATNQVLQTRRDR